MKAAIETIIVKERIRKEITLIPELAADIEINGLINPVTVMSLGDGRLQLLAGLRRVKAVQRLGWAEIEVNVVSPANAEAALRIEISENEQREPFSYSETMDYASLIEEIEQAKALERKAAGGKGGLKDSDDGRYLEQGKCSDAVGEKIGMSGRQYERAKYVAANAPTEIIEQLDRGERSISGTYNELKAKEKAAKMPPEPQEPTQIEAGDTLDAEEEFEEQTEPEEESPPAQEESTEKPAANTDAPKKPKTDTPKAKYTLPSDSLTEEEIMERLNISEKEKEEYRKAQEFRAMTPEQKVEELQRQLKEMRVRAVAAESDLALLRLNHGIDVDHKDSLIEYLKKQNADLIEALDAANARIAELEAQDGFELPKTSAQIFASAQ